MDANLLERYADLIVSVGANVQPDQVLAVEALPEAQPLVAAIARRAYEKGARYVDVVYVDATVKRIRAETAPDDSLEWVPPWLGRRMLDLGDLDAARAVLVPLVPPGLLDGVDPARAGRDRLPTVEEVFKVIDDRSVAWTLSPIPRDPGRGSSIRSSTRTTRSRGCGRTSSTSAVWTSRIPPPPGTRGSTRSGRSPAASTRSISTPFASRAPAQT